MKTLIVLTSPPACGKTTWARNFQKDHSNVFVVSSDEIRAELGIDPADSSRDTEVWETFDRKITEYANQDIENLTVIADSLCDLNKWRLRIVKSHPEYDRYLLVIFSCLLEESIENNKNRDEKAVVPEDRLLDLWNKFEKPTPEVIDCYDEFIRVIGNYKRTKVNK